MYWTGRSSTNALRDGGRLDTRCAVIGAVMPTLLPWVGPVEARTAADRAAELPRSDVAVEGGERVCDGNADTRSRARRSSRVSRRVNMVTCAGGVRAVLTREELADARSRTSAGWSCIGEDGEYTGAGTGYGRPAVANERDLGLVGPTPSRLAGGG
jgi:hypothetical protein